MKINGVHKVLLFLENTDTLLYCVCTGYSKTTCYKHLLVQFCWLIGLSYYYNNSGKLRIIISVAVTLLLLLCCTESCIYIWKCVLRNYIIFFFCYVPCFLQWNHPYTLYTVPVITPTVKPINFNRIHDGVTTIPWSPQKFLSLFCNLLSLHDTCFFNLT